MKIYNIYSKGTMKIESVVARDIVHACKIYSFKYPTAIIVKIKLVSESVLLEEKKDEAL